jgi:hypothetical protein
LLASNLCFEHLAPPLHHVLSTGPYPHDAPRATPLQAFLGLVRTAVDTVIFAPLMLTVHRSVLAGEQRAVLRNRRRLAIFAGNLFFITLLTALPGQIESVLQRHFVLQLMFLAATIVGWIATVRLLLTYPAAALDRPAPLRESWSRTKGHWWYISFIGLCGSAPLSIIFLVTLAIFLPDFRPLMVGGGLGALIIITTPVVILSVAFGAALISELYRKFGGLEEQAMATADAGNPSGPGSFQSCFAISAVAFVFVQIAGRVLPRPNVEHALGDLALIAILCMVTLFALLPIMKYVNQYRSPAEGTAGDCASRAAGAYLPANSFQRDVKRRIALATKLLWLTLSLNLIVGVISVCRVHFLYYEVPSPHNIDRIAWTRQHMAQLLAALSVIVLACSVFYGWLIVRIKNGSYAARVIGTIIAIWFLIQMPGRYFSDISAIYDLEILESIILLNALWLVYSHPGGTWFEKPDWKKKLML